MHARPIRRRRTRSLARPATATSVLFTLLGCATPPPSAPPTVIAMDAAGWSLTPPPPWAATPGGTLRFARTEGLPDGIMTVSDAIAASRAARFADGTISFDIKPLAYDDTGIIFRRQGGSGGEFVYLRANPDCPAADDCIQYAPITHGDMPWNLYSAEQGPAPIRPDGWNHMRIVVAGRRMAVFVNDAAQPSLAIPDLRGPATAGGIAFKGPAMYANLHLQPGDAAGLAGVAAAPAAPDVLTDWAVAAPTPLAAEAVPPAASIPPAGAWHRIAVGPDGLVDLGRLTPTGVPSAGWLRTVVDGPQGRQRHLRLGWAMQVTVFLNGREVFAGENPYRPVERRLSPDGRLEPDNATIPLDLRPGPNTIVLAVGNAWRRADGSLVPTPYGWGAQARLD